MNALIYTKYLCLLFLGSYSLILLEDKGVIGHIATIFFAVAFVAYAASKCIIEYVKENNL